MRSVGTALQVLGLVALWPLAASAQTEASPAPAATAAISAEDKGAARLAATQGIELYRAKNYTEALERLKKAQELFDAPVHLLYIARCQRELGQWVEAADTYRRLGRSTLPPNASEAFTNAVNDGAKELAELEPRIPRVLISVNPENAADVQLWLNDQPVPSAAIGVERPQNPGALKIKATATGFADYTADLNVAEGQVTPVDVQLATAAPEPAPVAVAEPEAPPPAPAKPASGGVGFLLGLRLGAAIPAGALGGPVVHPGLDEHVKFSSTAKTGLELELRVGVHMLNRVAAIVFFTHDAFGDNKNAEFQGNLGAGLGGNVTAEPRQPTADALGLMLLGGAPRGTSGPFVEAGVGLHALTYQSTFTPSGGILQNASCKGTIRTTSAQGRLGGGWNIPLRARLFHLMPYVRWTLGGAADAQYTPDESCADVIEGKRHKIEGAPLHSIFSLGLGGDFMLGG